MHPHRVLRRSALRRDEDVAIAVLDAHQRRLANGASLVARLRHEDHRQAGVAQRGALSATAALVELDLLAHPVARAWNILGHRARPPIAGNDTLKHKIWPFHHAKPRG